MCHVGAAQPSGGRILRIEDLSRSGRSRNAAGKEDLAVRQEAGGALLGAGHFEVGKWGPGRRHGRKVDHLGGLLGGRGVPGRDQHAWGVVRWSQRQEYRRSLLSTAWTAISRPRVPLSLIH